MQELLEDDCGVWHSAKMKNTSVLADEQLLSLARGQ